MNEFYVGTKTAELLTGTGLNRPIQPRTKSKAEGRCELHIADQELIDLYELCMKKQGLTEISVRKTMQDFIQETEPFLK